MNPENIVKAYEDIQSMKKVAREFGISEAKVKKILVSENAFESETSKHVKELYKTGKTAQEIAKILSVSISCVWMYLPYKKGAYGSDAPTVNALRIRECRKKKKRS